MSRWSAILSYVMGGLVDSVRRPCLWPIGPVRWACMLVGTAAQESYGDPEAVGAAGEVGIAQFTATTADSVGLADRTNPYESGEASAAYVEAALRQRPMRWIRIWLPVIGMPYLRDLWTHGIASETTLPDVMSNALYEPAPSGDRYPRSLTWFAAARVASLPIALALAAVAIAVWRAVRGR